MTIEELAEPFPEREHEPRTGVHLKKVVDDLFLLLWEQERRGKQEEFDDVSRGRMELGFLFEDMLSIALADRLAPRYPSQEFDGIWISPDGVRIAEEYIEEYKVTWASSKTRPPDQNWRWMAQTKAYAHVYGFKKVKFTVLWVCGDYSRPIRPHWPPRRYMCTFSELELQQNWQMILNHARNAFGLK